ELLDSTRQGQVAIWIKVTDVTRPYPSVNERLGRLFGLIPIPLEAARAAKQDFSVVTGRYGFLRLDVDHAAFHPRQQSAVGAPSNRIGRRDRVKRMRLREPIPRFVHLGAAREYAPSFCKLGGGPYPETRGRAFSQA